MSWYGHVLRKADDDWVRRVWRWEVEGQRPVGAPWKTWDRTVSDDLAAVGLVPQDARDRSRWKQAIRTKCPTRPGGNN